MPWACGFLRQRLIGLLGRIIPKLTLTFEHGGLLLFYPLLKNKLLFIPFPDRFLTLFARVALTICQKKRVALTICQKKSAY